MQVGTIYNHKCLLCKKDFISKRSHSKYCSDNCNVKYRYKQNPKFYDGICSYCKKQFKSRRKKSVFCSIKCKNHFYKNSDVEKQCLNCKKTFVVSFYQKNRSEHCSRSCAGITRWKNMDIENRKKVIVAKISESHRIGYQTGKIKKRFGEKSPCWKGGNSKLNQLIRSMEKNKKWRKEIFERDDFTCVICGDKGYINADHIKPLSFIIKENNIKNTEQADECDMLWDINNGRTLCVKCHKNTDTYGNRATMYCEIPSDKYIGL